VLQVRILEVSRIFQAKTQHAIKADVCDPDQGKGQDSFLSSSIAPVDRSAL
jgi:hypothetical protein